MEDSKVQKNGRFTPSINQSGSPTVETDTHFGVHFEWTLLNWTYPFIHDIVCKKSRNRNSDSQESQKPTSRAEIFYVRTTLCEEVVSTVAYCNSYK